MSIFEFEHSVLPRIFPPLLAGLLIAAAYHSSSQAAPAPAPLRSYIISDHDGYGVLECLTEKEECGKIVADSWCESHGHGPALAFGRAEDITGSTSVATPRRSQPAAATVTCGE
jgi:hypothetical protein